MTENLAGLVVPTRRRVDAADAGRPKITGITAVFLDYLDVQIHDRMKVLRNPRILPEVSIVCDTQKRCA